MTINRLSPIINGQLTGDEIFVDAQHYATIHTPWHSSGVVRDLMDWHLAGFNLVETKNMS